MMKPVQDLINSIKGKSVETITRERSLRTISRQLDDKLTESPRYVLNYFNTEKIYNTAYFDVRIICCKKCL